MGNYYSDHIHNSSSYNSTLKGFLYSALAFDIRRHDCTAQLKITRSSVRLEHGRCSPEPLPYQYQFYKETQLALADYLLEIISQTLGRPFDTIVPSAIDIGWRNPASAAILASAFQARIAMSGGIIPLLYHGKISDYWQEHKDAPQAPILDSGSELNETYFVPGNSLRKLGPTLRAEPSLYLIMVIMPAVTIIAFLTPLIMTYINKYTSASVLLPRRFNLVAILAGMDRDSLDVFAAREHTDHVPVRDVTTSGKMQQEITLNLRPRSPHSRNVSEEISGQKSTFTRPRGLRYVLGHRVTRPAHNRKSSNKWSLPRRPGLRSTASTSSKTVLLRSSSPTL